MRKKLLSISFLFLTVLLMTAFSVHPAVPTHVSTDELFDLKYQLANGTKFTMTSTSKMNSIMDQMGTEVIVDINGNGRDVYTVIAADKEKGLTIEVEFGDRSLSVDSMQGSASSDFSTLIGKKAKFVLLPDGKGENFEGFDSLPELILSTGETLNEETYILGVRASFPLLPDHPIKMGDSWTDNQNIEIPVGESTLQSEVNYTYTLVEETEKDGLECLKIEMTGITKISGDFEQEGNYLSIDRETTTTGAVYFAPQKGMFIGIESESKGEGIISVPSAGIDIPQTITSKSSAKIEFED